MASDNLNQLGRSLRSDQDETRFVTRRIAENVPQVERFLDIVSAPCPFVFEFVINKPFKAGPISVGNDPYTINDVKMNLHITEIFDPTAVLSLLDIPITITETGNSVGNPGGVGSQNVWYALAFLGDLNFIAGDSYSVVFDITTQGTNISAYKVVFDEGAVDLTNQTVITSTEITVNINGSDVLNLNQTMLHNVYVYSKVLSFGSSGDWIFYTAYTVLRNGQPYVPYTSLL